MTVDVIPKNKLNKSKVDILDPDSNLITKCLD